LILIVSFEDNEHVRQVTRHLTSEFAIVDVAWFPHRMQLNACQGADVDSLSFNLPDGRRIALDAVSAVWYRRIRSMTIDPAIVDDTASTFAWSESNEALLGVWYAMDCYWMNPPLADEVALRKIYQLRIARKVGLSIPETLVTNSPDAARTFIEHHGVGKVIRKAFRNIPQAPRETALVTKKEIALLDSVRFAPVIFQVFVPADLDLRVTVVDGEVFAAAVASDSDHKVDYRRGLGTATVTPYELPVDVQHRLLALMDAMGLRFGAVDFRVTPDGEHVFLEVNPAGEYLFISERTGQPIPRAIAAALERAGTNV
jgi:glutathione synthase/RimK-type ligase-like ATP-grasp enzyme